MKYKLFNTDGKTFFEFRSNPKSRCEGFTITYCDDGTVVLTGDYGCLCWKRNYNHSNTKDFRHDYGFPNNETNLRYFDEKICSWNFAPKTREWNKEKAIEMFKGRYGAEIEDFNGENITYKEAFERMEILEHYDETRFYEILREFDCDGYEYGWDDYTDVFKSVFKKIASVSEQIISAVKEERKDEK